MSENVGTLDRIVRGVLGLALLYFALMSGVAEFEAPVVKLLAIAVGVIMLIVAVVRICPIYMIFGFKTCRA